MRLRWLLGIIVAVVGIEMSQQVVEASEFLNGPNVGDYVYEDHEYITNGQYRRLETINKELNQGPNPQVIYLALTKNDDDIQEMNIPDVTDDGSQANEVRKELYDPEANSEYGSSSFFYKLSDSRSEFNDLAKAGSVLCYDMKNKVLLLQPSTDSDDFVTDFVFWKLQWGLNYKLKHGSEESRIDAILDVAERLKPKLQKVNNSDTKLKGLWFNQIETILTHMAGWAIVLQIIVAIFYHTFRNKALFDNLGSGEPDNSDNYDNGFYDGYTYGNYVDHHDDNDNNDDY